MKSSQYIAIKITERLQQLRWQKQELALRMAVASSTVTQWTSGHHNFTLDTLDRIQDVLGINFFVEKPLMAAEIPCAPCEFKTILWKEKT